MTVASIPDSRAALPFVAPHVRRTPLLGSRLLSEETGCDVRLKAELFQRTGSYKVRGPLFKLQQLTEELKHVNEQIWDAKDEIRECEQAQRFDARFIELARSISSLQERRAELKKMP